MFVNKAEEMEMLKISIVRRRKMKKRIFLGSLAFIIFICLNCSISLGADGDPFYHGEVFEKFKLDQNVETLSGTKTLVVEDKPVQKLDPNGSDRDGILPAEAISTDLVFFIYNTANGIGEDITIKNDASATIVTLGPGMGMEFICDGINWVALDDEGIQYDSVAGIVTIASLIVSTADINAGTFDGIVGGTTPATGSFTDLSSTGTFDCDRYETIWIPANQMTPTATNGATATTIEESTDDQNYDYYAFDPTTEEYVEFSIVMPEGWDRSTIKVKFYWKGAVGADDAETCEWEIGGYAIGDSEPVDITSANTQVISDTIATGTDTDLFITDATPAITIQGTPALGDLVHYKMSRNVGGTDDMDDDALLAGVLIQYKITNAVAAW